jgi:hypothetical protein
MHSTEIRQPFTNKRPQHHAIMRQSLRYGLWVVSQLMGLKRSVIGAVCGRVV